MEQFECVAPDIYRLKLPFSESTSAVLVNSSGTYCLIDSGADAASIDGVLVPALARMHLTLNDIRWLLCTHTHGDHIGGHARIHELAPGVKIAAFDGSEDRLRNPLYYSKKIRSVFPKYSPAPPAVLDGVTPDRLLHDGEWLDDNLRLIHTPGHDADAVCWLDERSRTLITGDSLQLNGTVTQGVALIMDLEGYMLSIERLLELDIHNIIAGHWFLPLGDSASGIVESKQYLQLCDNLVAQYSDAIAAIRADGVNDAPEIARALLRRMGSREPAYLFLPLYTVSEFLKRSGCV
ncbi:MBL fold metallo-hydrolase [Clostridia bacterium]|nr:MBL fold metallo-hydrolase [Clostridia bacterium]